MTQIQEERFEPPPRLGEHNEEVLQGLLGYSADEVENLRRQGAI